MRLFSNCLCGLKRIFKIWFINIWHHESSKTLLLNSKKKKALCFLLTTQLYLSQFPICYWWIYVFVFLVLPHRQLCDLHRFSNFLERYLWHRSLDSAILMQYIKKGWWSPHFTVEFLLIILSPFHIHSAVKNSRKKKMARSKAWNCQNDFRSISLGNL